MIVISVQMILMMRQTPKRVNILIIQKCFAPYHPHARKMFKVLKKLFKFNCVHKKTTTLGNLLFKRRPKPDIWGTTQVLYSTPPNDQFILATHKQDFMQRGPLSFNQIICKTVGFLSITLQWGGILNSKKQRFLREKKIA